MSKAQISNFLSEQVSITRLANYRILFGILILFSSVRFVSYGWVKSLYIDPKIVFPYQGFEWVERIPGNWMYLPFILLILSCLCFILGFLYRYSSILLFLSFTYIELLDKTNYLNHYYFVSLVSLLMIFMPANRAYSLDVKLGLTTPLSTTPRWTTFLLQFQIGIVYFFAGIAKIHPDWLFHAEPLRNWLQHAADFPVLGPLFKYEATAFAFAWAGMLFDLTVPFFLAWKKTRAFAYTAIVVFHVLTWKLFNIGVFPWVMIVSTTIFFSDRFHEWFWRKKPLRSVGTPLKTSKIAVMVICSYVILQLAIPMRMYLYSGNHFWHESGFRFGWRVMLKRNGGNATFYVVDRETGNSIEVVNRDYLTPNQERYMSFTPDMILDFAHTLAEEYADTVLTFDEHTVHLRNPRIECEAWASLNGSDRKLFVSRKHDLTTYKNSFRKPEWVEPYTP